MAGVGTSYPSDYSATYVGPSFAATTGRTALSAAMAGATAARPLGGISGVRPGTPTTIASATSTTWTVTPFGGYIDAQTLATNGGYFFSFQNTSTGTVTAAAGSARVDLLYVQTADTGVDATTVAPRSILDIQTGVAGAGIPTLTAPRAFVIAQINVPASGGGSPTVTWVAPYTVAAGGILPVPTTVYPVSPYVGQYIDDAVLGLLRWNGSTWRGVSPVAVMFPTSVNGGATGATGAFTSSSVALVRPNGVFTTAYPRYEVKFDITTATSTTVSALLSTVGVDAATGYDNERLSIVSSAATPAQSLNTSAIITGGGVASTRHVGSIFFDTNPAVANDTYFRVWATISPNPMTVAHGSYLGGGLHHATTAFDGLSFAAASGNLTVNYCSVIGSY